MATERRPHPSRRTDQPTRSAAAAPRPRSSTGRTVRAGFTEKPRSKPKARSRAGHRSPAAAVKAPTRIPLAHGPRRLRIVLVVMAISLSLCAGRLLQLQGFDSSFYATASAEQLTKTLPLLPSRGDITDRNGLVLASTEAAVAVTADPVLTTPKAFQIATVLSAYLHLDSYRLYTLLTKPNTRFVYLAKKVPALTYSKIAAELTSKKLYGVFRESDPIRTYPGGSVAASVVGYVDASGKGKAGLERSMNAELAGVEGKEIYESAPNGSKIPLGTTSVTPAVNGINYQLTIDSELQWMAERRIAAQVKAMKADSGFAITMNVKTGEILAMANAPTFDSADPAAANTKDQGANRAIADLYEPGSVEKILTSAALLDSHNTTVESRVKIPERLSSGGRSIKDSFSHGTLYYLMRGVIAKSSNIGTILMTRLMDKQRLHNYLASFGLGSRTGVELPNEVSGILPKGDMQNLTRDQIAFGQAVSVTGVQEAAAISGIINGGVYNPPTVIKSSTDTTGNAIPVDRRQARTIISPEASAGVRDLMRAVVDTPNGQKNLVLENYQTGGKTGTAQRPDEKCGCYKGYVTSYVGFAPLNDPQILTYVVVNNPRAGDTGTSVAAPVYKDIMNFALPRYDVAPNTTRLKAKPIEYRH